MIKAVPDTIVATHRSSTTLRYSVLSPFPNLILSPKFLQNIPPCRYHKRNATFFVLSIPPSWTPQLSWHHPHIFPELDVPVHFNPPHHCPPHHHNPQRSKCWRQIIYGRIITTSGTPLLGLRRYDNARCISIALWARAHRRHASDQRLYSASHGSPTRMNDRVQHIPSCNNVAPENPTKAQMLGIKNFP